MSITDFFISNAIYFGVLSISGGILLAIANNSVMAVAHGLFGATLCFASPGFIVEHAILPPAVVAAFIALIGICSAGQIFFGIVMILGGGPGDSRNKGNG